MITRQIKEIEGIINGTMIENPDNDEKILYTFETRDNQIIFIEQYKRSQKDVPNYNVCTNSIDCWDGYDDARHVIKHLKQWSKGLKV